MKSKLVERIERLEDSEERASGPEHLLPCLSGTKHYRRGDGPLIVMALPKCEGVSSRALPSAPEDADAQTSDAGRRA
jgi:hypothetical protein